MRIQQWFVRVVFAVLASLALSGAAGAAVDVNTADQAALESVKGIGPAMSGRILAERGKGKFRSWSDLADRVSGLGDKNTLTLSHNGLVVDGKPKQEGAADATSASGKVSKAGTGRRPATGDASGAKDAPVRTARARSDG